MKASSQPPKSAAPQTSSSSTPAGDRHAGDRHAGSSVYQVAAGLLWTDRAHVILAYLCCAAPRLALTLLAPTNPVILLAIRAADRAIRLAVLAWVIESTRRRLGAGAFEFSFGRLAAYFSLGMLSWLTLLCPSDVVPFEVLWTVLSPGGIGPALFMALPAAFVWYMHYFWPLGVLLPRLSLPARISLSRFYVQQDPWLPVKTVLGPTALMYLPTLLVLAPYPDGRSVELSLCADALSGIQWILCAYLFAAFGFHSMPEPIWSQLKLDPYRGSRLNTLEVQGPTLLAKGLRPRFACQLLGLCCLVWAANLARLSQLAPSPKLSVDRAWIENAREVHVSISLSDPVFHARGFHPLQFRLTSEDDLVIYSAYPEFASLDGAATDVRVFFPPLEGPRSLQLRFSLNTKQNLGSNAASGTKPDAISSIGRAKLWYGGYSLGVLSIETPSGQGQSSGATTSNSSATNSAATNSAATNSATSNSAMSGSASSANSSAN